MWQPFGTAPAPDSAVRTPRVGLGLCSSFCRPSYVDWQDENKLLPAPCPMSVGGSESMTVLLVKGKKKSNPKLLLMHPLVCGDFTYSSCPVLWEASFPVLQPFLHICVCSTSQVGWPQPFLKQYIMSRITYLAGRLSWHQQGLLDNPHPSPWEEQHHKDH